MNNWALHEKEHDREMAVRTLTCPNCGAKRGGCCSDGLTAAGHKKSSTVSHTGRYNKAVARGLVPALAGSRG